MTDNPRNEIFEEVVDTIVQAVTKTAATAQVLTDAVCGKDGNDILISVVNNILIALASHSNKDSVVLAVGRVNKTEEGEQWSSHIHFNYRDTDPAHLLDFECKDGKQV